MKARPPNKRVQPTGDGGGVCSPFLQETLHLISIPGMRDSIRKGMAEPLNHDRFDPANRRVQFVRIK